MEPYVLIGHQLGQSHDRLPFRLETACKMAFAELAEVDNFFECSGIHGAIIETTDPRVCFDDSLLTVQIFGIPRDPEREHRLTLGLSRRLVATVPPKALSSLGIAFMTSAQSQDDMLREPHIQEAIEFADHHFNMHLPEDRDL